MVYIHLIVSKSNKENMLDIVNNLKIMDNLMEIECIEEDYWKIEDTLSIEISGKEIKKIDDIEIEELFCDIEEYGKIENEEGIRYIGTRNRFTKDKIFFVNLFIENN